uniref:Rieske domain-containing protein n=1 Tax=Periophthalmus magnuspinnatus TaxID=409849 RepID=A0A3B3ZNG0_9GOBI
SEKEIKEVGRCESKIKRERRKSFEMAKVVLTLDSEAVDSLKDGINFKKNPQDAKCYIIYKSEEGYRACKNQCKHQGGLFIKDIEDLSGRYAIVW